MSIRLATVGYVPPKTFPGAAVFFENVHKFKTSNDLFLYSDDHSYGVAKLATRPEELAGVQEYDKWGINNAIFITGVRLAIRQGYTHMIYIESDCRVGCPGWDGIVFEEFFSLKFPVICAGSIVTHQCINGGAQFYHRFETFIGDNRRNKKAHPIPIYGVSVPDSDRHKFPANGAQIVPPGHPEQRYKPAVYPNGALGVYDLQWLGELFHIKPDGSFKDGHHLIEMIQEVAWDHALGRRLYDRFGSQVFDVVAHLDSVYSSYGNRLETEDERLQMVRSGRIVATHQVKSAIGI